MKKFIVSVALAAIFVLSLTSFTGGEKKMETAVVVDCEEYAVKAVQSELVVYGGMTPAEYLNAYVWYYERCLDVNY